MIHFFKLVHMEVYRFLYILLGMMGITAIVQCSVIAIETSNELERYQEAWQGMDNPLLDPVQDRKMSFSGNLSDIESFFSLPIILCIAVLVIYVFLIWYRDWFGQRTFIYRLFMLPASRRHIYMAKLSAIMVFVFSLVAFQFVMLIVEQALFNRIVPADMRIATSYWDAIERTQLLVHLMPRHLDQFVVNYGLGMIGVTVIFASILLERSYRRIGILLAIVYAAVCAAAMTLSIGSLLSPAASYLYPSEEFAIIVLVLVVVSGGSIWLGFRLLHRKVSV